MQILSVFQEDNYLKYPFCLMSKCKFFFGKIRTRSDFIILFSCKESCKVLRFSKATENVSVNARFHKWNVGFLGLSWTHKFISAFWKSTKLMAKGKGKIKQSYKLIRTKGQVNHNKNINNTKFKLFSFKKEGNLDTCYSMGEPWRQYTVWNKPDTKGKHCVIPLMWVILLLLLFSC